jgi:hypothetical protein
MTFKASPIFTSGELPSETREALRAMFGQLPIVFALRAGGELRVPVAEVDATGGYFLEMEVEGSTFVFKARKKS